MSPSLLVRGLAGRLLSGSRLVTRFERAEAKSLGGGHFRLTAERHEPDPFWWEHRDPERGLICDTKLGRMTARFIADEPLTLEIWERDGT